MVSGLRLRSISHASRKPRTRSTSALAIGGACVGDVGETVGTLLREFYGLLATRERRLSSLIVVRRAAGHVKYQRGVALVRCLATDAQPSPDVSPTVTSFDRIAYYENEPPISLVPEVAQ
jgi:hypothetical protein